MLIRPHHHKNTEPHGFEFTKDSHHCLGIDLCSFINLRIHSKGKSDMTKYSSAHWGESQGWLVIVCLSRESKPSVLCSQQGGVSSLGIILSERPSASGGAYMFRAWPWSFSYEKKGQVGM